MKESQMFDVFHYDHIGIRVSDRSRAVKFYKQLGFSLEAVDADGDLALVNKYGLRINLIPNASGDEGNHNILLDEPVKYTGVTHPAFTVHSLDEAMAAVRTKGIEITGGPKEEGRRRYFFIRDPDGTVLEFNEILAV